MCIVYAHAVGTTGLHAPERRAHPHAAACEQCGVPLTPTTRVAAHVLAYPCALPCCGFMTLKSTCKKCNAQHRAGERSTARRCFCGSASALCRLARLSRCMCVPVCVRYDACDGADGAPPAERATPKTAERATPRVRALWWRRPAPAC